MKLGDLDIDLLTKELEGRGKKMTEIAEDCKTPQEQNVYLATAGVMYQLSYAIQYAKKKSKTEPLPLKKEHTI